MSAPNEALTTADVDVLIVGAGFIGATLAIALSGCGLRIAIVESRELQPDTGAAEDQDLRAIALSWSSRCIFESLDIWDRLSSRAYPLQRIHISDRGHFGAARLDAADQGVEALGYVAPAAFLGAVIHSRLRACEDVDVITSATLSDVTVEQDQVRATVVTADASRPLSSRLLVVADGGSSGLREQLGFKIRTHDYQQAAIVTMVEVSDARPHTAFERFSQSGPMAMLPFDEHRYGVVWTVERDRVDEVMASSDEVFVQCLQHAFGFRLGRILRASGRSFYPLSQSQVESAVSARVVLAGSAAHTLHPIAGQGINLGFRDIAMLAEVLAAAMAAGQDIGNASVLHEYARQREVDYQFISTLTDGLARLFMNPARPVVDIRNLALLALDVTPPLRQAFCRRTIGLAGTVPRLVRGLGVTP